MNVLRKRELLLSLKYCTIEACFSVPMLNLTLTQFPFILGFAVTAMGWQAPTNLSDMQRQQAIDQHIQSKTDCSTCHR